LTTDEVCAARLLPRGGPCLDLRVETASGCGSGGGAEAGWPLGRRKSRGQLVRWWWRRRHRNTLLRRR
jgi:hypothetical protein